MSKPMTFGGGAILGLIMLALVMLFGAILNNRMPDHPSQSPSPQRPPVIVDQGTP